MDRDVEKIAIFAVARSGHHAVLDWIAKGMPGKSIHYNSIDQDLRGRGKVVYKRGEPLERLIYSGENLDLRGFKELFAHTFDRIGIVVRDPFNHIASSMRKGSRLGILDRPFKPSKGRYCKWFCQSMARLEMMKQYLQQVLGDIDLIGEPFLVVNYNRWVEDEEYRRQLAQQWGINPPAGAHPDVPGFGGGSSFDGRQYKRNASQMQVNSRWKEYADNVRYINMLDPEMVALSKRMFGSVSAHLEQLHGAGEDRES